MSTGETMIACWGADTLEGLELDSKAPGEPVLDAATLSHRIAREMTSEPEALRALSELVLKEQPVPEPSSRLPKGLADRETFELCEPEYAAGTLSEGEALGLDWFPPQANSQLL